MRVNEPITDREVPLPEGELLVSRTDTGGRIAFCNQGFVKVSGFAEAELTGAPHNIVRHPHMPSQTARSTEEITRQIGEIQAVTGQAVQAVGEIGRTIGEISEVSTAIAAAMEEQAAATREIARNVADSGAAVREVTARVAEVSQAAGQAGELAAGVRAGTGEVDGSVGALQATLMRVVRTSVREADRRLEPRFPVSEPCVVTVAGGARRDATLLDVSARGALIGGLAGVAVGAQGVLTLERHGGARTGFTVRGLGPCGAHVALDAESEGPAWRHAFEAMTHGRRQAVAA